MDDDSTGLGPPLYENQTLADSGMRQGYRVILEPGVAPLDSQVTGCLRNTCIFETVGTLNFSIRIVQWNVHFTK